MRHIATAGILGVIDWNASRALMLHMNLSDPYLCAAMCVLAALAAAVTATMASRIGMQNQSLPLGISYDLGFRQGYRTAEQKYLQLIAQLNLLKGHIHGKGQSPPER
ncbi:hypothetical protein ACQEVF_25025 [Nonomuraea polychroma]|uniref:hypothetical protein n=1 Tax=Nonomuraea polychroma TaxID=46176 RepID=UPI003D9243C5